MRKLLMTALVGILTASIADATKTMTLDSQNCIANSAPETGSGDLSGSWSDGNILHPASCAYTNDLRARASKYGIYQVSCTPQGFTAVMDTNYSEPECACDKDYADHSAVTVANNCAQIPGTTYFVYVWSDNCPF